MKKRQSGVLMHISSLPGKYGIGSFGQSAYDFVDFLVRTKQRYWQILPLGTTSYGDSPYQSFSAFAGNTYFIDFDILIEEGLLDEADVKGADFGDDPRKVDYAKIFDARRPIMEKAVARFLKADDLSDYESFVEQNAAWLEVFAEYMAIKEHFDNLAWTEWPDEAIRRRDAASLASYRENLADKLTYHRVTQYLFFKQWLKLKAYANEHHIEIVGDMPIYVAADSADVWAQPHFFKTDAVGKPTCVAGCPPDEFSETGQLWGNPIYDWEAMDKDGYAWWIERLRESFKIYDIVRIDHFRAFDTFWKIPASCPTAIDGEWIEAPGYEVIDTLNKELPGVNLVAEDLGELRPEVLELKDHYHLKGMRILLFSIDTKGKYARDISNDIENVIFYTGTHDNDTLMQWYDGLTVAAKRKVREFLKKQGIKAGNIKDRLLTYVLKSKAEYAIIPLADIIGLGKEGHINTPGTVGSPNWEWHMVDFKKSKEELSRYKNLIMNR